MAHLDDETVALAAIGETLDQVMAVHLAACGACRDEVETLTRVVNLARSTADTDELVAPPAGVWARIAAETGVDPGLLPVSLDARRSAREQAVTEPGNESPNELAIHSADASAGVNGVEGSGGAARPGPARSTEGRGGSRRTGFLVAASVAGLLLGVGGTLGWQYVDEDGGDVVASATLAALPDRVGTGTAEVVDTEAGRELAMTLDMPIPSDAFLQVWLLSPDTERMVPVGVIAGSTGHWTLPPDVTLADYPLVDVSIEPYDGDPGHSTNSAVRGALDLGPSVAALDD